MATMKDIEQYLDELAATEELARYSEEHYERWVAEHFGYDAPIVDEDYFSIKQGDPED